MKKKINLFFMFFLIMVFFISCNDPVYHIISQEVPKVEPLIKGAPTNLVKGTNGDIYTASGSILYRYTNSTWTRGADLPNPPGGRISHLALTSGFLYAVCANENGKGIIKYTATNSFSWKTVSSIVNVAKIFAVENKLYIGVFNGSVYSLYYLEDNGEAKAIEGLSSVTELIGVEVESDGSNYYIFTKNQYFYSSSSNFSTYSTINFSSNDFMGTINLGSNGGNKIVAINRDGNLYEINGGTNSLKASFPDRKATGALALWTNNNDSRYLLLAGRADVDYSTNTGHTYGYVEIEYTSSGIQGSTFWVPGEDGKITSVADRNKYVNSIGKNPINHIIQAKDRTLFASTVNGIWSDHNNQWNAVE